MKLIHTPFQSYWCFPRTVFTIGNTYTGKGTYAHWELHEPHSGLIFWRKHMKMWANYLSGRMTCKSSECNRLVRRLISCERWTSRGILQSPTMTSFAGFITNWWTGSVNSVKNCPLVIPFTRFRGIRRKTTSNLMWVSCREACLNAFRRWTLMFYDLHIQSL